MIFSYQKEVYVQDQAAGGLILQRPVQNISRIIASHTGYIRRFKVWGSTTIGTAYLTISVNGVILYNSPNYFTIDSANDVDTKSSLAIPITEGDLITLTVVQTSQAGISGISWQVDIDDQATLVETTAQIVTASLANLAQEVGTIVMAKGFVLKRVVTSNNSRIRLYQTAAARTADSARPFGDYSWLGTEHKIITDLLLNGSTGLDWDMSPPAYGISGDHPATTTVYYAIQNTSGGSAAITVTFYFVKFEA